MEEKDFLTRYDNGEKFSEKELKVLSYRIGEKVYYGENRRWLRTVINILKFGERYFALEWEEGLTENQENEFCTQPYEVYPVTETKFVSETIYVKDKPKQEIMISNDNSLNLAIQNKIVEFVKQARAIKEMEDELKEKILQEMEAKGIKSLKSDELSITYKEPTYRETFDSKELKADNEELYNKYIKISPVKASIMLKVK